MVYCACCGRELSADSDNDPGSLCAQCFHAMDTGEDLAPAPETLVPQSAPVSFPITKVIVLLNCAVFVAMGFPFHGSSKGQLLKWGADWGPLSLDGQLWRIFTSMFVHDGLNHILANMLGLWIVGKMAERIFGRWFFLCLYAISGVAGTIVTLAIRPEVIHCGASGAIFGLLGAVITATYFGELPEPATKLGKRLWPLLIFAAYSLFSGAKNPHINNAAHIGGLSIGVVMGFFVSQKVVEAGGAFARQKRRLIGIAALILALSMVLVRHYNSWVIPLELAREAIEADKLDDASRYLMMVLEKRPNDVQANVITGAVYIEKADYAHAEASLKRALAVDSHNTSAEYTLGLVYLRSGRFDDALDITAKLLQRGVMGVDEQALFAAALDGKGNHVLAGDTYLDLHYYDEAIASFQKALQQKPDDEHSKQRLAQAYRAKGMNEAADALER
jgi:membrane associated rhomboid family serine protease/cytochrome c-type biogenesis protein CcmH/NrfG